SLAVGLDLADGPGPGVVGVGAEFGAGAALTEQVPALVEAAFELLEALLLLGAEPVADRLGTQLVLLGDQLVDVADDSVVAHVDTVPDLSRGNDFQLDEPILGQGLGDDGGGGNQPA